LNKNLVPSLADVHCQCVQWSSVSVNPVIKTRRFS